MKNLELQNYLKQFSDDMLIMFLPNSKIAVDGLQLESSKISMIPLEDDNILHTSFTTYIDSNAPEDEWDNEDGKVKLGDGEQYLLINPIIV